jgi:magnesium transporter
LAELITYDKDHIKISKDFSYDQVKEIDTDKTNLIIASQNEKNFINEICNHYRIHHLLIEDIFTRSHIPKLEIFDGYYFLILKYLEFDSEEHIFQIRQASIFLLNNIVMAFTEDNNNPVLREVKLRLNEAMGNLRIMKADFLFYRIVDLIVDQYMSAVNYIRAQVDDLDDRTIEGQTPNISKDIVEIKRQINRIRRISGPLREEIIRVRNFGPGLIRKSTLTYFQDILDHLANNMASLESFRDILSDMMEIHVSQMSANMNQVMKALTVVTTIFIPLTFIAGVYGMNFHYLPEIRWKYGYLMFWVVIIAVTVTMVYIMRKKKWF